MWNLVVFDLDGTLVDSREDLASATNVVVTGYGAPALPMEAVTRMVGDGARTLVQRALLASALDVDLDEALEAFHRAYASCVVATTRPYPGIERLLDELSPVSALAVLTNKPLVPTQQLLAAFGWTGRFGQVIGGDGPMPRKPDPTGLLTLMREAGAAPGDTLMVGDSMADVGVASHAGTAMCFAAWGFGNARGDVMLRGTEIVAQTPADVPRER